MKKPRYAKPIFCSHCNTGIRPHAILACLRAICPAKILLKKGGADEHAPALEETSREHGA